MLDWIGWIGYLQTGPFLDHLAVIITCTLGNKKVRGTNPLLFISESQNSLCDVFQPKMLFKEEKVLEVKKKVSCYDERTRDEEFQLFLGGHLSFAQQQHNRLIFKKINLSGGFCDISYRLNTATDKTKSGMM